MSALDDALDYVDDNVTIAANFNTEDARAELAQLLAQAAELAAARTAVEQARAAIDDAVNHHGGGTKQLRTWLAAHPAPQAEQEQTA